MSTPKGLVVIGTPRFDFGRISRAANLLVQPLGFNLYRVTGGAEGHVVNLTPPQGGQVCDCADHRYRGTVCKHQIALVGFLAKNKGQ